MSLPPDDTRERDEADRAAPNADRPQRRSSARERKKFLLRLPPDLMEELRRWANDDFRSLNAQLEFILRDAVRKRKRKR